jgi:hypothetical protein
LRAILFGRRNDVDMTAEGAALHYYRTSCIKLAMLCYIMTFQNLVYKYTSTSTSVYPRQLNYKSVEIVFEIFHEEVREAISENPEIFCCSEIWTIVVL